MVTLLNERVCLNECVLGLAKKTLLGKYYPQSVGGVEITGVLQEHSPVVVLCMMEVSFSLVSFIELGSIEDVSQGQQSIRICTALLLVNDILEFLLPRQPFFLLEM